MAFAGADGSAIAPKPSRGGVFAAGFDMCTRMRVRGAMRACGSTWVIVAVCRAAFG